MKMLSRLENRMLLSAAPPLSVSQLTIAHASQFIVSADFNGDHFADLATSSFSGKSISLLAGNGKGAFHSIGNISLDYQPDFLTSADLNKDGRPDLISVNFQHSEITILLGRGKGTFGATSFATSSGPRAVVVGDFNADGKLDLALARSFTKQLTILPGRGNGTFGTATSQTETFIPSDLASGDFNHDGKLDLAAVDFFDDKLYVLRNNGNATFASATSYSVGSGPTSIVSADLNADGRADLAVANFTSNNVSVLLNNGSGAFGTTRTFSTGSGATFITSADFNRDGHADLIVANSSANTATLLRGVGNGNFEAGLNYRTGTAPRSIAVGDFNRDSRLDFAVANESSSVLTLAISDTASPTAKIASAATLTVGGGTSYRFTVNYIDDHGINKATLDGNDVLVTGPNGYRHLAKFVSATVAGNTTTASYAAQAPDNFFKPKDNGRYTITLEGSQVKDGAGNVITGRTLGSFTVAVTDAGNSLASAKRIASVSKGKIRYGDDYVGIDDRNDYFQFDVTKTTRISAQISGLYDDADLQILNSKGSQVGYSKNAGRTSESLTLTLSRGTYYARVLFTKGVRGTGYRLRIAGLS